MIRSKTTYQVLCAVILAIGMLAGCASSKDGKGKDCVAECADVPEANQDECIIVCEGEV